MYIATHITLFYLLGKGLKLKKMWIGMIASIFPDLILILFKVSIMMGASEFNEGFYVFYNFLHSIFPLFLLLLLLMYGKWYFYTAALGFSSHIFLDYFTHENMMPLYPLTKWSIPISPLMNIDIRLIFITHIILMVLILFFWGKKIRSSFNHILKKFHKNRVYLFSAIFIIIAFILAFFYNSTVLNQEIFIILMLTIVTTVNFFLLSILFLEEIYREKAFSKFIDCLFSCILRPINALNT